ncbi:nuclear transport factor 2 family protein [Gordonia sp. TBRC 11910]|uniref:Nuclear transport factor 2 family protein n=1 Tax=Gordonia asplenii TaxID=2725283 RepID=A0A848KYC4_9ACTN|nr:nuclear transport factor 2 family protein [Gordonia asplenii]NMO01423.1 nuclear transport factor 2 family protein [Gordonia asplenii]
MAQSRRGALPVDLEAFCDEWFRALKARDTQAVVNLTTPDIVWDDTVFWPKVVHGHEELTCYLDVVWSTTPDYDVEELDRYFKPDGTGAVVLWCQTGSAPAHLATGKRFAFEGCDVLRAFSDGKLSHYQAGYEIVEMCRQLGLIPPRGNRLGAAYLMSLRSQP